MSSRRALIVDDSKTAQVRLRKMLQRYEVEVDTASSAEEALSYLSYRMPAVVFMDHLMPGLDGFEALKIIKSNPHTAMIPIVMYTSKSGDLYVGQARALGAIDVLSKDVIEPSNLENVLRVIGIIPAGKEAEAGVKPGAAPVPEADTAPIPERVPVPVPPPGGNGKGASEPSEELDIIRRQVAKMLEINIAKVRHEISSQSRLLYKRLNHDIKELRERREPPPAPVVESGGGEERELSGSQERTRSWLPQFLVLVLLAVFAYQLIGVRHTVEDNARRTRAMQSSLEESRAAEPEPVQAGMPLESPGALNPVPLLSALQWALSMNNRFGFGDLALGDRNLLMLQELVSRLDAAGFRGMIVLSVHFGNFCVVHGDGGDTALPPGETSLQDCRRLSEQLDNMALQDHMSVSFINFLVSSPVLNEGGIEVDLRNHGFSEPRYIYPEPTVSAGDWNRVAALNNRLEILLRPEGVTGR